jgi:hypothetical protein
MSKKPKIEHDYHPGKDKLKITISGYDLSKKARDEIMKKLIADVERKPDRLIANANKEIQQNGGQKASWSAKDNETD